MANSYKNITITPNIGSASDPRIQFSGGNTTVNTDINLYVYPTSNGTVSFEGAAGQLFSITNDLTGSIFSVNDVSGIPSIDVNADGTVRLAPLGGSVNIGNSATLIANGSVGSAGQVLHTSGAGVYWAADDVGAGATIPAGTLMLFQQTAAPTGWTKQTTHNDKALRVVSGAASSGGTTAFSTVMASRTPAGTLNNATATGTVGSTTATGSINNATGTGTIGSTTVTGTVGATTLGTGEIPSHTHTFIEMGGRPGDAGSAGLQYSAGSNLGPFHYHNRTTDAAGSSGSHSHSFSGGSHNHTFTGDAHGHTFTGTAHNHTFTGDAHGHTFTGTAMDFAVKYVDLIIASKD